MPECEDIQEVPDIFNEAAALDPEPADAIEPEAESQTDTEEEPEAEEESLF